MLVTEQETWSQLGFAVPMPHSRSTPAPTNLQACSAAIPRALSGHKRSAIEAVGPPDCLNASKVVCRNLFSPGTGLSAPASAAHQQPTRHPSQTSPASPPAEASSSPDPGQAQTAQTGQPPSALTPVRRTQTPHPWSSLFSSSSQVLRNRLTISNLLPATTATGQQLLQSEAQLQALLGMRQDEEGSDNICWVDHSFVNSAHGVLQFYMKYGDAECAQMLVGLRQTVSKWHLGPNRLQCYDEHHNFFQAQGPKGAAACLMKRLVALFRMRAQIGVHQPVLDALLTLVQALQQRFREHIQGGLYTFDVRPLVHQVITVQKHWQSNQGPQHDERAVHMLQAMTTRTLQLPGPAGADLVEFLRQLLDEFHPQADLVQEQLRRHVQHLLKFGRAVYDPLQYNAVVADISRPLLINAGPGSGKTTVMALRALYIIGMLRQSSRNAKGADDVVALTFSRRAQQHMGQTLDGLCVRVAHNHTFDGLWLRMTNDFNRLLTKPAVMVMGQEEVKQFVSGHMQAHMELRYQQGRCRCKPKGSAWKDLLDTMSELLTHHLQQGFVRYTSVGLYSLKQVWAQPIAQRNIMYELRQDARLTGELYRSQLTLSGRDLELAMQSSVTALVNSLQDDDAIVWELLGNATRIWHIASGQLSCQEESVSQAAKRIFGYWSSRQAWLLDEFQDVAHAQYRLLHALTSSSSSPATGQRQRVTIVGDGDQAIYDWRGADVLLFEEQFEKDYSAVQRLEMTINYRSTQSIVARSNALIACSYKNPSRAGCQPKALQAAPGAKDNHEVQFVRYRSKETQGQHILECVKWWHDHGVWWDRAGVEKGPGVPYSQIRILARAKWQLYHLKGVLERGGLKPHVVLAGDNSELAETQDEELLADAPPSSDKLVLSSVHAVKGLECVVCFVAGLDTKAWRYLPCATAGTDLQQTREARNVAYVAMTRAERVLYLSHVGPPNAANSFFDEARLPDDPVVDI